MSEKSYDVIFSGQLVEGAALDQVKANVAALFKTEVAKIERLFIGMPVAIKRDVDEQTALKYLTAMKRAGAICEAKEKTEVATEATPAAAPSAPVAEAASQPSPPPSTEPEAGKSSVEIAAGEEGETRFVIKEAPQGLGELAGATLDQPGVVLIEHEEVPEPVVDISGMSMDTSEADLVAHEEVPDLMVDTGGMILDEPGVTIIEPEEVPDLEVDTSGMILDEPGVIIIEHEEVEEPAIDVSKLSLS